MTTLTTEQRNALPPSAFVYPSTRRYPIPDISHARNALARVSQDGTPGEQKKVRATVYRRFPSLRQKPKRKRGHGFVKGQVIPFGKSPRGFIEKNF